MSTGDDILIETRRIGTALRVTAMHAPSGTEVVFQAPATASRHEIDRLAAAKLRYVLNRDGKK